MTIAIKEITKKEIEEFESNSVMYKKYEMPDINLADLAPPHENIAIVVENRKKTNLDTFSLKYDFKQTIVENTKILSKTAPHVLKSGTRCIFSGYAFTDLKMIMGAKEFSTEITEIEQIKEKLKKR